MEKICIKIAKEEVDMHRVHYAERQMQYASSKASYAEDFFRQEGVVLSVEDLQMPQE